MAEVYSRSFERDLILKNYSNIADITNYYTKWSERYDKDMSQHKYSGPDVVVNNFVDLELTKDVRILDILCGTGLVGLMLKDRGFDNIDGQDGSQSMLDKAMDKEIYRSTIHSSVGGSHALPVPDETYDVVLGSGVFAPGHATPDAFPELLRITRHGGYLLWARRISYEQVCPKLAEMNDEVERLIDEGLWRRVKAFQTFPNYFEGSDGCADVLQRI